MSTEGKLVGLDELVSLIRDGCSLAVPRTISGAAMAATRALIRRGVKELHLVTVPTSGLQAELLIGAGCVATIETSAITLDEYGAAPRFAAAVRSGAVRLKDSTCPAIHAALQAGEKGIPFMPLRGIIGSDLLKHRADWKLIDNPFAGDDPIVAVPALIPDVALFHAPLGDRFGNVWVGLARELVTLAHAARGTVVTVEEIHEGNLLEDERLAPATLSELYVSAVAEVRRGAWPLGLAGRYPADAEHLGEYTRLAATEEGFERYLARHVSTREAAE